MFAANLGEQAVAVDAPLLFSSGIIDGTGFTYNPVTGTFTALSAGDFEFDIIIDADDGAGALPEGSGTDILDNGPVEYFAELPEVPSPTETLMDCQVVVGFVTQACSATFIMSFVAGQQFTLTNVGSNVFYFGDYENNASVSTMQMTVRQLD
jgi:hypothetical protein